MSARRTGSIIRQVRKVKLLYILPEYDIQAPTHHVHLFEMLAELGKEMDIFLLVEKSAGRPEIANLERIYIPKNFFDRFWAIIWARTLGYKKAYVHYSYWGAILASLVFRPTRGKVFYWHCEVYDQFFSRFDWSWSSLHRKLLDEYLMVLTLKLVSFLVTGTKTVGEFYRHQFNLPKNKIKIVPNWVNLQRFQPTNGKRNLRRRLYLPENKRIVTFAHRLAPRKGADRLPEIITSVSKKVRNGWFLVAGGGGGNLRDELVKVIKKQKLEKSARLVGGIPNLELPRYLAASDLFIMPSRQEGFPRILIECMACGLPFVAMDVGGTKDIINSAQKHFLIPANNTRTFINTTINLLRSTSKLRELSSQGQIQVQKYSLEKVSKKFLELFSR